MEKDASRFPLAHPYINFGRTGCRLQRADNQTRKCFTCIINGGKTSNQQLFTILPSDPWSNTEKWRIDFQYFTYKITSSVCALPGMIPKRRPGHRSAGRRNVNRRQKSSDTVPAAESSSARTPILLRPPWPFPGLLRRYIRRNTPLPSGSGTDCAFRRPIFPRFPSGCQSRRGASFPWHLHRDQVGPLLPGHRKGHFHMASVARVAEVQLLDKMANYSLEWVPLRKTVSKLTFRGATSYLCCRRVSIAGIFTLWSTTAHFPTDKNQKLRLVINEKFSTISPRCPN